MADEQIETAKELLNGLHQRIKNLGDKFVETQKENNRLKAKLKIKEKEYEELKAKIEYVFSDTSPNFDYFCDICVAKDKCNQNCCFEQIKELIYEVK